MVTSLGPTNRVALGTEGHAVGKHRHVGFLARPQSPDRKWLVSNA